MVVNRRLTSENTVTTLSVTAIPDTVPPPMTTTNTAPEGQFKSHSPEDVQGRNDVEVPAQEAGNLNHPLSKPEVQSKPFPDPLNDTSAGPKIALNVDAIGLQEQTARQRGISPNLYDDIPRGRTAAKEVHIHEHTPELELYVPCTLSCIGVIRLMS